MLRVKLIIILVLYGVITSAIDQEYQDSRSKLIKSENRRKLGAKLNLTEKEKQVNRTFMTHKYNELSLASKDPSKYAPSMHFFKAKHLIEKSAVFKFLKKMPKGGALHLHALASVSPEWIIKNITYLSGMKKCINLAKAPVLTFRPNAEPHMCSTDYIDVNEERKSTHAEKYDKKLAAAFNLFTPTPEKDYPSINKVWGRFVQMFFGVWDALHYLPAAKAFYWRLLEELYEDNIMYAELRVELFRLYTEEGRLDREQSILQIWEITEQFKKEHPDFLGIRLIYNVLRSSKPQELQEYFSRAQNYTTRQPDKLVGFDLSGPEDSDPRLLKFADDLIKLSDKTKFFFHAGETNSYGNTDLNLVDAILLNTTRIGLGYALPKHPVLMKIVKKKDIAVEVCPISNQVLHLVEDLRNHPGAILMANNIPMVISNDAPAFWGVQGLSYDYYYTIMSLASKQAGLKTLKQLVFNSIKYSALPDQEKEMAETKLEEKWNQFIDNMLADPEFNTLK
uniref:Adenosine deaminase n=1 Tax=Glossina brevipalpis TaxID=37001 RepID=A0A1A9WDK6_9MUSC